MDEYRVAFIGHRHIKKRFEILDELYKIATYLIGNKEFVEFLVGKNGEFDETAAAAVRKAQNEFGKANSTLVWVQPYKTAKDEYAEKNYDEIIFPPELYNIHYKRAIEERNKWMVNRCDFLVAYVEGNGNARKIFDYGVNSGKYFVNVVNLIRS